MANAPESVTLARVIGSKNKWDVVGRYSDKVMSMGYTDNTEYARADLAAAPDLLEALEGAAAALEWAEHHLNEAGVWSAQVSGTIPEARAAIAKAKGE